MVNQCFAIQTTTRERLRIARLMLEDERSLRRLTNDVLLREMAEATIRAVMERTRRAGGHAPDALARAKARAAAKTNAKPTTHGPAPTAGSVYEH